jgi:hypothetical protein
MPKAAHLLVAELLIAWKPRHPEHAALIDQIVAEIASAGKFTATARQMLSDVAKASRKEIEIA